MEGGTRTHGRGQRQFEGGNITLGMRKHNTGSEGILKGVWDTRQQKCTDSTICVQLSQGETININVLKIQTKRHKAWNILNTGPTTKQSLWDNNTEQRALLKQMNKDHSNFWRWHNLLWNKYGEKVVKCSQMQFW